MGGFIPIVQVLRAVAIALVVAGHAAPDLVPGGLVGVDVFFVISGFLILGQIVASVDDGRFDIVSFYKRRALRILPPYAVVILASTLAASIILVTPQELADFQRDLGWSAAFASNVLYADVVGYFDDAASRRALLHLWSLAVEEQFYIAAPLAVLAAFALVRRLAPRQRRAILWAVAALVALASLLACISLSGDLAPRQAFYLTPFRLWEFLLGGATRAAIPPAGRLHPRWRSAGLLAGLSLILVAAGSYSVALAYPGWFAILPAAGAALVIASGTPQPGRLVGVLATPPMLYLGRISYELYLWHWPILVFARTANFGDLPAPLAAGCVVGALVLAGATHAALVRPLARLRATRGAAGERWVLGLSLVGYATIMVALPLGVGVVAAQTRAQLSALLVPELPRSRSCNVLLDTSPKAGCGAQRAGRGLGLVLGDSHAGANFPAFQQHAQAIGAGLEFASFAGCTPFLNVDRHADSDPAACRTAHRDLRQALRTGGLPITFAVLTAQWLFHVDDLIGATQQSAFIAGLRDDIATLELAGAQRVLVYGAPPLLRREPGDCVVRAARFGYDRITQCGVPLVRYAAQTKDVNAWIRTAIADDPEVRFVDPQAAFCGPLWCAATRGDVALFSDHSHLSRAGAELLATAAGSDLDWVLSAPAAP